MMRFLLDANAVIALLNDRNSRLARRVRQHEPADICVSSIVIHELYYGVFESRGAEHDVALVDSLQVDVREFDKEDARAAGQSPRGQYAGTRIQPPLRAAE